MSSLEQLYQQVILDHSRKRSGEGPVAQQAATSHQVNPTCGDEITLGITLSEDGSIESLSWEGDGCSISQASISMMTDLLKDASRDEVSALYRAMSEMMHSHGKGIDEEKLDLLGDAAALEGTSVFANRIKCSLLGWQALRDSMAKLGYDISEEQ